MPNKSVKDYFWNVIAKLNYKLKEHGKDCEDSQVPMIFLEEAKAVL